MSGWCVPGRARSFVILLGILGESVCASAQPTAGFPPSDEPVRAPPPAPPPSSTEAPPELPSPGAAEPAASGSTPPQLLDAYGSELPPTTALPDSSIPLVLPYRSGFPVPAGYHVESVPALGLIVGGALTLGAGYAFALGYGLDQGFDGGGGWLLVPVVGPWGAVASREFSCGRGIDTVPEARDCFNRADEEATKIAVLAVDGMLQATGLVILLAGLGSGRKELVRDDAKRFSVSATSLPGGMALGVNGQF